MRRVLAVVPDLFFATRIAATAKALGVELATVSPRGAAALAARAAAEGAPFALVLLDLHAPDALDAVRALLADPATASLPTVGFFSHVDIARRDAAVAAGVRHTLPRSAFTARLPQILRGDHAALPDEDPA